LRMPFKSSGENNSIPRGHSVHTGTLVPSLTEINAHSLGERRCYNDCQASSSNDRKSTFVDLRCRPR
jgi:hypothetical protein